MFTLSWSGLLPFLLIIINIITSIESAKILVVFPYWGPSQYISAGTYFKALAARGHEVTVISRFPQKTKIPNFRDIVLDENENYEDFIRATMTGDTEKQLAFYSQFFRNATTSVLESKKVQELLFSKNEQFDLVIMEMLLTEALYAIGPHFNAHLIGFSTCGTDAVIDQWTGNPSPLSYIPLPITDYTDKMTFWQRLNNFVQAIISAYYVNYQHLEEQRTFYKKYFPHLPYELEDISKNFSLVLLNQHFSLSFPRPYIPNMIEVGGLYIQHKPTPLPEDIQRYIDEAEHGVIYFSMGSNVKSKYFHEDKRQAVMKVLGSLKERVLWKYEDPNLPDKPENVLIKSWFPQQDILAHPKVKLFITHGGLLSTIESIYFGKPIVGVPVLYDQFNNIARAKSMGFGSGVNYVDLTEKSFKNAIHEVLNNESCTKVVREISKRYHDQPIKPLDLAIYWTEYVLRHNGAPFMQVQAKNLSLFQYFCLDVISFILLAILLSIFAFIILTSVVVKLLMKLFSKKIKNKSD